MHHAPISYQWISMELLYWFYDILLLSMSLAQESQAAAFGGGGGLVPAGPWFSGTGAEQNHIPCSDVCQVTRLEEGLLPTLRNAEGSGSMVPKIYPHTHGHISVINFIISSWKNIGKSGFYMFPPNPTFAHTQITHPHLCRSGHTTAL